jgi:hypothetical protein
MKKLEAIIDKLRKGEALSPIDDDHLSKVPGRIIAPVIRRVIGC